MTLIDVLLQYSGMLTPSGWETRRAALLEMSVGALALEAQEFCGGAPWREWQRIQAARDAFDELLRTP